MVVGGHKETLPLASHFQRFRIGAVVDDLWQTVQPGPGGEQQAQRIRLQFCQVTFLVSEWIECSRLNHLFKLLIDGPLTLGQSQAP